MSNKEFEEKIDSLKRFNRESSSTAEKAREVLVRIGVLDTEGKLTEPYDNSKASANKSSKPDSRLPRNGQSGT
jgi:hypothetical protein